MQPPSRRPSSLSWKWLPVWEGFPCRRFSFFGGLGLLSCLLLLLLSSLFSFSVVVPLSFLAPCLFVVCLVALPLLLFLCLPPCPLPRLLFPSLSGLPAYRRYHVTAAAAWLTALLAPSQFLWVGACPLPGGPRSALTPGRTAGRVVYLLGLWLKHYWPLPNFCGLERALCLEA